MTQQTVYSKTPKGLTELTRKKSVLPEIVHRLLGLIDGQSDIGAIFARLADDPAQDLQQSLEYLQTEGLIKQLAESKHTDSDFPADGTHISVTEFDAEEGVAAWAEARRCAKALDENGFYAIRKHPHIQGEPALALVIEDTESTAFLEMTLLKNAGFTPRHAANGKQAWEIFETMIPDLVILDVNLPDTNGLIILETLRRHPRLKDIPVILVTAQFGEEDVMAGIRAGADGYIFKPFQQNALVDCVRRVLKIQA
ncbi:MAG: response regulator [Proteobacteria bacterium]|nr:response regulator [Pseudomonadota bacterium]